MEVSLKSMGIVLLTSCIQSVNCYEEKCERYVFKIQSMANEVNGVAAFDFKTHLFSLNVTLDKRSKKFSYNDVKIHLHRKSPIEVPSYPDCKGLGKHYDPTYHCGPKSEFLETEHCSNTEKPMGTYEAGDITAQHQGPLKLYDGRTHIVSFHFHDFNFVKGLSLVMHTDISDQANHSEIIGCSQHERCSKHNLSTGKSN